MNPDLPVADAADACAARCETGAADSLTVGALVDADGAATPPAR
jgi:hypothetical protein